MLIKMLGIVGSPRPRSNTEDMMREALKAAEAVGGVETELYLMHGKNIGYCKSCWGCIKEGRCVLNDDLHELVRKWLQADAVLIGSPVYHMAVSANLKAAIDRLGNSLIAGRFRHKFPRFSKVIGAIAQGGDRYGGVELTLQQLIDSALLMNCIPVGGDFIEPGDTPAYIGAAGYARADARKSLDEASFICARSVGRRVAETAKIIKAGMKAIANELPEEYFPDLTY